MQFKVTEDQQTSPLLPLYSQEMFEELWNPSADKHPSYPILINFTAKWCGPCQRIDWPFLLQEFQHKFTAIYKCDVDENKYTPGFCGARKIPSWCILKGPKQMIGPVQLSDTSQVASWIFTSLQQLKKQ